MISMIACMQEDWGIGYDNNLLWKIPEDLIRFKRITHNTTVVMGWKTWESIGHPLNGNRLNVVLSRNHHYSNKAILPNLSFCDSVDKIRRRSDEGEIISVIGGASLYKEFMTDAEWLYLTMVHNNKSADTFFPELDFAKWTLICKEQISTSPKADLCIYKRLELTNETSSMIRRDRQIVL